MEDGLARALGDTATQNVVGGLLVLIGVLITKMVDVIIRRQRTGQDTMRAEIVAAENERQRKHVEGRLERIESRIEHEQEENTRRLHELRGLLNPVSLNVATLQRQVAVLEHQMETQEKALARIEEGVKGLYRRDGP